ncbi:uncharacterized protein TNIN_256111 [Trichonephila inaurata madagascariensis]|uniref:Uncharacterized protein n=1 Tax=Trichonephila inaurata madagascariensis TaxID=2747483 RepID=A0A8X6MMC2_9ARAC|nr:uncharacterized protein TNIN_256111 [Trichonephila inaurata madagascariensis]
MEEQNSHFRDILLYCCRKGRNETHLPSFVWMIYHSKMCKNLAGQLMRNMFKAMILISQHLELRRLNVSHTCIKKKKYSLAVFLDLRLDDLEEPVDVSVEHGRFRLGGHDDAGQVVGDGVQLTDPSGGQDASVQDLPPGARQVVEGGDEQKDSHRIERNQVGATHRQETIVTTNQGKGPSEMNNST